eukprot:5902469-Prymnesium_polylepis.1
MSEGLTSPRVALHHNSHDLRTTLCPSSTTADRESIATRKFLRKFIDTTGTREAGRTVPIWTSRHVSPDQSVRHKQDACKKDPDPTNGNALTYRR